MKVSERPARIPVARSFSQTESLRRKVLGQYLSFKNMREEMPLEIQCRVTPSQTRCLLVNVPQFCLQKAPEKKRSRSVPRARSQSATSAPGGRHQKQPSVPLECGRRPEFTQKQREALAKVPYKRRVSKIHQNLAAQKERLVKQFQKSMSHKKSKMSFI